jgi:hypothetical protein
LKLFDPFFRLKTQFFYNIYQRLTFGGCFLVLACMQLSQQNPLTNPILSILRGTIIIQAKNSAFCCHDVKEKFSHTPGTLLAGCCAVLGLHILRHATAPGEVFPF